MCSPPIDIALSVYWTVPPLDRVLDLCGLVVTRNDCKVGENDKNMICLEILRDFSPRTALISFRSEVKEVQCLQAPRIGSPPFFTPVSSAPLVKSSSALKLSAVSTLEHDVTWLEEHLEKRQPPSCDFPDFPNPNSRDFGRHYRIVRTRTRIRCARRRPAYSPLAAAAVSSPPSPHAQVIATLYLVVATIAATTPGPIFACSLTLSLSPPPAQLLLSATPHAAIVAIASQPGLSF
ncbi:hypothetical protein MUK42_32698 [Musa troglodytarum]|uniref:Uncharacterized protein n=1 Tax=Musa troglodytarum TaxID=320322 RepID=A0A9E7F350_9LILI|nr:hypothetical protein MUK42_32698 [Musa troglodytarum]